MKSTCLLLGAGSSVHLQYPVGAQLLQRICERLRAYLTHDMANAFQRQQFHARLGIPEERLKEAKFRTMLSGLALGDFGSPDAFLEKHSGIAWLGKALIAERLSAVEEQLTVYTPESLEWYELLRSWLFPPDLKDFPARPLSIVTFNYDRSLDCFLHQSLMWKYGMPEQDAWQVLTDRLPVVHVHGVIAPYPEIPYGQIAQFSDDMKSGKSIRIISEFEEPESGFCSPEFERASALLMNADQIITLGFAFGEANVRRMRFFGTPESKSKDVNVVVGPMAAAALQAAQKDITEKCDGHLAFVSGKCGDMITQHRFFR